MNTKQASCLLVENKEENLISETNAPRSKNLGYFLNFRKLKTLASITSVLPRPCFRLARQYVLDKHAASVLNLLVSHLLAPAKGLSSAPSHLS